MFLLVRTISTQFPTLEKYLSVCRSIVYLSKDWTSHSAARRTIPGCLRLLAYLMFLLGLSPVHRTILERLRSLIYLSQQPAG